MKPICVLLAIAHTLSCLRSEAEVDWLQTDSYRNCSDCRNIIWSYRNNTEVNEDDACNQTPNDDNIIEFGPDTQTENCAGEGRGSIYKWHVSVSDDHDVYVTISKLYLNENADNYLIISPGPSLVKDEASVVITGEIQKPKMFGVVDHNEMTVLLVIPKGITNDTWMENNFTLFYEGISRDTPDTTTPTYTSTTTGPSVDRDATVYVKVLGNLTFDKTQFQKVVADMAHKYCNYTNIPFGNRTGPEDVQLTDITGCSVTWPNWERCIRITMIVNVPDNPYQLNRTGLEEMWKMYASDMLKGTGFEVFVVPDDHIIFHLWLPISLAVLAIFTLLMVALWHCDVFNTSKKKDAPFSADQHSSKLSSQTWVSNSSYQEVPPMTDLSPDDIYTKPRENSEITTSTNTHSVVHERPKSSDQFGASYLFQRQGYDNPSFNLSSERYHSSKADYHDNPSSDDDSSATTSTETKSHQDHLHTAPKQATNEEKKHESAV